MGDALDIDVDPWAPWDFPWEPSSPSSLTPIEDPSENPDVVCHFCEAGVLASHVNREFAWLESAFASVSAHGYQPRSGGHIRCLVLVGDDRSSFIVLDGNHRISALHALGVDRVEVKVSRRATVRRDQVDRWPGVLNGSHSIADSLRVFDRYFDEVNRPWRCLNPARLIVDEPPLW
jgi:hypothetical protein